MLNLAWGSFCPTAEGTLFLAFLLTVRERPGKWPVESKGQPMGHLGKEPARIVLPASMQVLLTISRVSRTQVYRIHRYILYMISI